MIDECWRRAFKCHKGHIIDAVVERARLLGRNGMVEIDESCAIDTDGAQITGQLVSDKADTVAVKLRVGRFCKDERALALAIGNEHARTFQLSLASVWLGRQVVQQRCDLGHGRG